MTEEKTDEVKSDEVVADAKDPEMSI